MLRADCTDFPRSQERTCFYPLVRRSERSNQTTKLSSRRSWNSTKMSSQEAAHAQRSEQTWRKELYLRLLCGSFRADQARRVAVVAGRLLIPGVTGASVPWVDVIDVIYPRVLEIRAEKAPELGEATPDNYVTLEMVAVARESLRVNLKKLDTTWADIVKKITGFFNSVEEHPTWPDSVLVDIKRQQLMFIGFFMVAIRHYDLMLETENHVPFAWKWLINDSLVASHPDFKEALKASGEIVLKLSTGLLDTYSKLFTQSKVAIEGSPTLPHDNPDLLPSVAEDS